MRGVFAAAFATLVLTGAAQATDLAVPPAVVPVLGYDWTGFYVGFNGMHASGNASYSFAVDPSPSFTAGPDIGTIGGILGAQFGYAHQFGNFVVGLEGRMELIDAAGSYTGVSGDFERFGATKQYQVVAQAGYAINNFLPYVSAGAAILGYDYTAAKGAVMLSSDQLDYGGTVGAGLKVGLGQFVLFGEYEKEFFAPQTVGFAGGAPTIADHHVTVQPVFDVLTGGFSVKF
jgi:outer membrane immunogenic protein